MARVAFENKESTRSSSLPAKNQVSDADLNELKESVNALYDITDAIEDVDETKEDSVNKQDSLAVDGTGVKFPTVDAVNAGLTAKEATANKDASNGYAGLTLFKINFKNVANTFTSFFTNSNTGVKTYTFQDRNGTIADDTDLATKEGTLPSMVGNALKVLRVNAGETNKEWATISSGLTIGTTAITSGTVGRILFEGTGNVLQEDSTLFWDNTNKRLGIGATPASTVRLDVRAQGALSTDIAFRVRDTVNSSNIVEVQGIGSVVINNLSGSHSALTINKTLNSFSQTSKLLRLVEDSVNNSFSIQLTKVSGYNKTEFLHGGNGTGSNTERVAFTIIGDNSGSAWTGTYFSSNVGIGNQLSTDGTNLMAVLNGTAPTVNDINAFKMYSSDIVAGNAAPHFRTENGNIIKLFKGAGLTASDATLANAVVRIAELEARLVANGLIT